MLAFLKHKRNVEGRSEKYVDDPAAQLDRFGNYPGFASLDSFTYREIESFVAELVAQQRPREATRNRHLAALKSLMSWARDRVPPLTRNTAETTVAIGQEDRNVRPPEPVESERWRAIGKRQASPLLLRDLAEDRDK